MSTPDRSHYRKQSTTTVIDEEHHAMMNGPRVAQAMPEDYIKALLVRLEEIKHGHKNCTKDNCESSGVDCPAADA